MATLTPNLSLLKPATPADNGLWGPMVNSNFDAIDAAIAAETAARLAARVVSVVDFGAVGDNVADDTAAIQAAINTGRSVVVPKADYKVTAGVVMQTRGQRLIFESGGRLLPKGNFDVITLTGNIEFMGVSGLYCDATGMTGGNVIAVKNAHRVELDDLTIWTPWNGIYVEQSNVCRISRLFLNNAKGAYCIQWFGSATKRSDVLALYEVEVSCGASKPAVGLLWDGNCNTLRVQGFGAVNCKYGVQVVNTSGGPAPMFGMFDDLEVDFAALDAVRIETGQHFYFSNLLYLHGSVAGSGLYTSATIPADHLHVVGGKITSHARYGIENGSRSRITSPFFSGNTLGNISGAAMTESQKFQVDANGYLALSAGSVYLAYDANDFRSYNRATNTEILSLNSIAVETASETAKTFGVPVRFPAYTFATVPSAATFSGHTIRITDRLQRLATSDGTSWRFTDGVVIT